MTLQAFLSSLSTENIKATIISEDTEVCTIFTKGVDALDEVYKEQTVVKWEIVDRLSLRVFIEPRLSG